MIRIYYDSEFTGLHRNSTLISIGMVTDRGSTFYAEFIDYDKEQVNDWINENVIANLKFKDKPLLSPGLNHHQEKWNAAQVILKGPPFEYSIEVSGTADIVREQLSKWLQNISEFYQQELQFYVDCYAYDWMLLVDLLTEGKTAIDMPNFIDYIPVDLSTVLWSMMEDPDVNREKFAGTRFVDDLNVDPDNGNIIDGVIHKHNALWDAKVIKHCFQRITRHCVPDKCALIYTE